MGGEEESVEAFGRVSILKVSGKEWERGSVGGVPGFWIVLIYWDALY